MKFTTEINLTKFDFWSGAKSHKFTYEELEELEFIIEDLYHTEPPSETDINDLFWFEEETLCEWVGLDFEEYLERQ